MTDKRPEALPHWWTAREVVCAALVVAALVLATAALFVDYERREITEEYLSRVNLYTRVLEQQTANLLAGGNTLTKLVEDDMVEGLATAVATDSQEQLTAKLTRDFRDKPHLRSVSVVSPSGIVVASSSPGNLGSTVSMADLGEVPAPAAGTKVGTLQLGRDIGSLARPGPNAQGSPLLPLLRTRSMPDGAMVQTVQLVNLDYLAGQLELTLKGSGARAAIASYQGILLADTGPEPLNPGAALLALKPFAELLPVREAGLYAGAGLGGTPAVVAFRTLADWPLVVLVQIPQSVVNGRLHGTAVTASMNALSALLLIGAATMLVLRSLRRHRALIQGMHEANRAIAIASARSKAVVESSLDGIITIDAASCIVDFNQGAELIFGYWASDVLGKPMASRFIPASLMPANSTDGTAQPSVLRERREASGRRSDGTEFLMEITIVPVSTGDAEFFTCTIRDITDRKRQESEKAALVSGFQQLASELETQKLALDEHAIVSITNTKGIITYANEKLLEISGYSHDEIIGKHADDLRVRSLQPEEFARLRECMRNGQLWRGELAFSGSDGRIRRFASTVVPVADPKGGIREFITVQTDVTPLREAERALDEARLRELDIGTRIQQSLLIAQPGAALAGLWMASFNQASRGIDGDFVEVIHLGENTLDLIAGDVMGKGVPAALMGAATKLQISRSMAELLFQRGTGAGPPEPRDVVTSVNRAMAPHLQALEAFVTLVYLRINLDSKTVTWVGCGHEETLMLLADGKTRILGNQHPPVGLFVDAEFEQESCPLAAGDSLFLCSDGAVDALLEGGEHIGRDRINTAVAQYRAVYHSPAMVLHALRRDLLLDHVKMTDDLTLVMLVCPDRARTLARIEVPVALESLAAVRAFVEAQSPDLPEVTASLFLVAVVEVVTNVIRHATGLVPDAPIELVAERTPGGLELNVIYLGDHFEPPADPPEASLDEFPEGGFGLHIIFSACDQVDYLHEQGLNTVRLRVRNPDRA